MEDWSMTVSDPRCWRLPFSECRILPSPSPACCWTSSGSWANNSPAFLSNRSTVWAAPRIFSYSLLSVRFLCQNRSCWTLNLSWLAFVRLQYTHSSSNTLRSSSYSFLDREFPLKRFSCTFWIPACVILRCFPLWLCCRSPQRWPWVVPWSCRRTFLLTATCLKSCKCLSWCWGLALRLRAIRGRAWFCCRRLWSKWLRAFGLIWAKFMKQ